MIKDKVYYLSVRYEAERIGQLVSGCIIRWDLYKREEIAGFVEDLDGHLGLTL
jgi:hypothetical protein